MTTATTAATAAATPSQTGASKCPRCDGWLLRGLDYERNRQVASCVNCGWYADGATVVRPPRPRSGVTGYHHVQVLWNGVRIKTTHLGYYRDGRLEGGLLCGAYGTSSGEGWTRLGEAKPGQVMERTCQKCLAELKARQVTWAEEEKLMTPAEPIVLPVPPPDDPLAGFEPYRRTRATPTTLEASLDRRAHLRLSASALAALGNPEWVRLHYHRARRVIAVQPVEQGTSGAMPVQRCGESKSRRLSAKGFCDQFGIAYVAARSLPVTVAGGLLLLDAGTEAEAADAHV